ncbi:MAG: hypothetical protein QM820_61620 [Minicystis sp.]
MMETSRVVAGSEGVSPRAMFFTTCGAAPVSATTVIPSCVTAKARCPALSKATATGR